MTRPLWLEIVATRLVAFCEVASNESVFFDYATLFHRILKHKVLMDHEFMITDGMDLGVWEGRTPEEVAEKIEKLEMALGELKKTFTAKDVMADNYHVGDKDHQISFMEFFWLYVTWFCFAEDTKDEMTKAYNTFRIKTARDGFDKKLVFTMSSKIKKTDKVNLGSVVLIAADRAISNQRIKEMMGTSPAVPGQPLGEGDLN